MERIFFDNNATTKLDKEVFEAIVAAYQNPLNSSSIHSFGRDANKICNNSREQISKILNGQNYEIIFTSGGTEANNLGIFGLNNFEIITSNLEHSSVLFPAQEKNAILVKVKSDGIIDLADLETKLNQVKTPNFLVSIMLANNETGVIQPVKEIAKLVHRKNGLIHSDLVQVAGKIAVDLEDLNIDLASISAHKFGGPQGIGALLVRKGIEIKPMILGGGQESFKRSGTLNIAAIAGFGKAVELIPNRIKQNQNLSQIRDYLEKTLLEIGAKDVTIFGQNSPRLPNTSLIATKGINNQMQLINFDLNGIAVSIGAACSSGSSKNSRILQNMAIDEELIKSTIRISLGIENNKYEIDKFITIWQENYLKNKK